MSFGIGIESSCDETSIAIVKDGKDLLALTIHSQIENHAPFFGVVPELASRSHLEKINGLLDLALTEAGLNLNEISYVAVTSFPGLMGSLLIGAQLARCISLVHGIPIISVNHLEAHLAVVSLEEELPPFPVLGTLLSGGNSSIYAYTGYGKMELLGDTMDDALGEAFDKVGSMLKLPYPGGPHIESLAESYDQENPDKRKSLFPKLLKDSAEDQINFSFSGLKTAVMYYLKDHSQEMTLGRVCSDFQSAAFELVIRNIGKAIKKTGIRNVICAGGVMANGRLRRLLQGAATDQKWTLFYPRKKVYCTDNGAMVACLGYYLWKQGEIASLDFQVSPRRKLNKMI